LRGDIFPLPGKGRGRMHIFLTGGIGSGKSVAVRRTLKLLQIKPGGFQTYFGPDRAYPDRYLYLCGAGEVPICTEEYAVARFENGVPSVFTERFDGRGARLLKEARLAGGLIVMDECGYLEREARRFQEEVIRCLDGNTPVLGVVRLRAGGWTERIVSHPKVKVLTVEEENRDAMPSLLLRHFQNLT